MRQVCDGSNFDLQAPSGSLFICKIVTQGMRFVKLGAVCLKSQRTQIAETRLSEFALVKLM